MRPKILRRALVLGAVASLLDSGSFAQVSPPPSVPTSPATTRVADGWDSDKVLAAVTWREGVMDDCSFSWTETLEILKPEELPGLIHVRMVDMHRRAGVVRFRASERHPPKNIGLDMDWDESWDGQTSRGLYPKRPHEGRGTASVTQTVPPLLTMSHFLEVAGLQLRRGEKLSNKLRRHLEVDRATPEVRVVNEGGERVIELALRRPKANLPNEYVYGFLPDKDFAIKYVRVRGYKSPDFDRAPYTQGEFTVTEHVLSEELWMPSRYSYTNAVDDLPTPGVTTSWRGHGELKAISSKVPTDEEMALEFPPGTRVVDSVAMEAYVIQPDGSRVYEEIFDSNTGRVVSPPPDKPTATRPAPPPG